MLLLMNGVGESTQSSWSRFQVKLEEEVTEFHRGLTQDVPIESLLGIQIDPDTPAKATAGAGSLGSHSDGVGAAFREVPKKRDCAPLGL